MSISQNWLYAIGTFVIAFILGFSLVIPIFAGKSGLEILQEFLEGDIDKNIADVGEEIPPEAEAYHYWYAPENSFGIPSTKTVNWSYFKSLFLEHTDWMLEYKRYEYSDWTDGSDYLTIERTWNDTGFWKFNLIFDVPVHVYSARFTFGIDLNCLQYVERSGYEVWINYSANTTETYSCMFNWSDIASIPNLVITKGVQDGMFWFRFRRDNIPTGHYEFDPTFGNTVASDIVETTIENRIAGGYYQTGGTSGTADNITIYLIDAAGATYVANVTCGLYEYIDHSSSYAGALVGQTEVKEISVPADGWHVFNFSEPKPSLSASTNYYIVASAENFADGNIALGSPGSGGSQDAFEAITWSSSLENPWSGESSSSQNRCIYCSYTEGAEEETWQVVDDTINGSIYNLTTWKILDSAINGSIYNISRWNIFDSTINGSIYNVSRWNIIDSTINGSIYNLTTWKIIDATINGSIYNISRWNIIDDIINGSIYNLTLWKTIDNTINGSIYNTSNWYVIDNTINGSIYNITVANIIISNPYPANESTDIPLQIIAYLTITNIQGNTMTLGFYYGNSTANATIQLGATQSGLGNGTYNQLFYPATNYSTTYYWRVYVNDGTDYVNNTFHFTTTTVPGDDRVFSRSVIGVIGIIGLVGLMIGLLYNRRKKRRTEKEKSIM